MKIQFICLPVLFLMASCGADGSQGGSTSNRTQSRSEAGTVCKTNIRKYDAPATIAVKAYRIQEDCKFYTEEALVRKLGKL
jgi:hypothetical protein